MTNKEQSLRDDVLLGFLTETLKEDEAHALLDLANGAPILQPTASPEQKLAGMAPISHVLDTDGDVLISGQKYLLREKPVLVLRETFGSGNLLDTYYRVWHLNTDLDERFEVVGVKYRGNPFGGGSATYPSQFKKIV